MGRHQSGGAVFFDLSEGDTEKAGPKVPLHPGTNAQAQAHTQPSHDVIRQPPANDMPTMRESFMNHP